MRKKERIFITNRKNGKPTCYYPTGKIVSIKDVGAFPRLIKREVDESRVESTFCLAAVIANFIYYLNKETDDENALLLNREMQLVSDNYFAYNDLCELVAGNASLLWISKLVAVWQREQYIKPHLLTPEIKKALNNIDTERLSEQQKDIYLAYRTNGPVKYSKAQSLMAVLSNVLCTNTSNDPVTPIWELISQNHPGAF